ncbi:MAG: hypothetical protein AB7V15_05575 [Acidimicrobiia bacterium]
METEAHELDAADVVWDLSDLLDGRDDEAAVLELVERAEVLGAELAGQRGRVASFGPGELAAFMGGQAELAELIGRADSWASLRFAADVNDPARGP